MKKLIRLWMSFCLAGGILAYALVGMAPASPQYGGDCAYCHIAEQPDAMDITGYDETELVGEEQLKVFVFDKEKDESVALGFNVDNPNPGPPLYYKLVVRGLDRLNGADEHGTPMYLPRLYEPDPTWDDKSTSGQQYLFWEGQFYGTAAQFAAGTFTYNLEIGPDVEFGDYEIVSFLGGGFPARAPGKNPEGGWHYEEDFLIRVVPEPGSIFLLLGGLVMVFGCRRWRCRALPVALVMMTGMLSANVAYAWPSRAEDCSICHSIPGPSEQTGDFAIKDADGNETAAFEAEAGTSTEFLFEFTQLAEDSQEPGTVRQAYLIVEKLDLLSVDPGAFGDIPYTEPKYTADVGEEEGQWHNGRYVNEPERYIGSFGQYFAQSSADPAASMPFPLELAADVPLGTYNLTATMAGGRPSDELYLDGWFVRKDFTLSVTAPGAAGPAIPEPGSLTLLALAIPGLWHLTRRRRLKA